MLFKSRVEWNIIKCLLNHTRLVTGRREWGIRQINCYSDSSTITRFAEDNNYVASILGAGVFGARAAELGRGEPRGWGWL